MSRRSRDREVGGYLEIPRFASEGPLVHRSASDHNVIPSKNSGVVRHTEGAARRLVPAP